MLHRSGSNFSVDPDHSYHHDVSLSEIKKICVNEAASATSKNAPPIAYKVFDGKASVLLSATPLSTPAILVTLITRQSEIWFQNVHLGDRYKEEYIKRFAEWRSKGDWKYANRRVSGIPKPPIHRKQSFSIRYSVNSTRRVSMHNLIQRDEQGFSKVDRYSPS